MERVHRAVAGDRDALSELLELYGPQVEARLRIAATWRSTLDTADVMQVTYLEAFTHIRQFDPNRADKFGPWLQRMAENNLRDAIRGLEARKHPSPKMRVNAFGVDSALGLFEVLTSGAATPSRVVRTEEAAERLRQALCCLPADYALTVRLYDLEGRSVDEVATALGRSPGAVYMLRSRAHDRLHELLGGAADFLESRT